MSEATKRPFVSEEWNGLVFKMMESATEEQISALPYKMQAHFGSFASLQKFAIGASFERQLEMMLHLGLEFNVVVYDDPANAAVALSLVNMPKEDGAIRDQLVTAMKRHKVFVATSGDLKVRLYAASQNAQTARYSEAEVSTQAIKQWSVREKYINEFKGNNRTHNDARREYAVNVYKSMKACFGIRPQGLSQVDLLILMFLYMRSAELVYVETIRAYAPASSREATQSLKFLLEKGFIFSDSDSIKSKSKLVMSTKGQTYISDFLDEIVVSDANSL